MNTKKQLLAVVELGGYPDFTRVYESMGFEVSLENSVRNANRTLKKLKPEVVIAEFNFQSDFRDRTSNLESLLSSIQRLERCDIVVFFEKEYEHQLEKLRTQYTLHSTLAFPVEEKSLRKVLSELSLTE